MNKPLSLYRRVLGTDFDALPSTLRDLHDLSATRNFEGEAEVLAGSNIFSRGIAMLTGFPTQNRRCKVEVRIEIDGDSEVWHRNFGGHRFHSRLRNHKDVLMEHIGPHHIYFQLVTNTTELRMQPIRWKTFGIPLPRFLWPQVVAHETEVNGRFQFDVSSTFPLIGLVVRYQGWLLPK